MSISSKTKWSILVCGMRGKEFELQDQLLRLDNLIEESGRDDIEVLCFYDYKRESIGSKRNLLMGMANGDYVSYLDDDDSVRDEYITHILAAIDQNDPPDLVTFDQEVWVQDTGERFVATFKDFDQLTEDGYFKEDGTWVGIPNHFCVWRKKCVERTRFPDTNWREDLDWMRQAKYKVQVIDHIDNVLLDYHLDPKKTPQDYE